MSIKGCILPWIHLHGNITGDYKVCCFSDGAAGPNSEPHTLGTHKESINEVWNNDNYKKIRKDFLKGKIPVQCQKPCYDREIQGGYSHRQEMNYKWEDYHYLQKPDFTQETGYLNRPPIYLDIRFGNICNFRCRMCGSFASSKWAKEKEESLIDKAFNTPGYRKIHPVIDTWTDNDIFWKDLKELLPHIEEIYFAGGEPLMQEGHYKLLHFLIDNQKSNLEINYNTNLSVLQYKNENLIDLWKQFKNVGIWVSQDGVGKVAEYIRKELDWKLFDKNFKKVLPYIKSISCTYQAYNVYSFIDLYAYAKKHGLYVYPSLLTEPSNYSAQILPKHEKKKVVKYYKNFLTENKLNFKEWEIKKFLELLTWLMHEPENREQLEKDFKIRTEVLDKSRNEKFTEVVPQLAEWYKNIKL